MNSQRTRKPIPENGYSPNHKEIARQIKESVHYKCEFCGKQCRRPEEPFTNHKYTIQLAHLDHNPQNNDRSNLRALCVPCHMAHDNKTKRSRVGNDKVNNSFLYHKVVLRKRFLPQGDLLVLDAFAGDGLIWNRIRKTIDREIEVISLDREDKGTKSIKGNNLKYMKSIDLNQFDVIDLDDYSSPILQLEECFNQNFKGVIFITYINANVIDAKESMLFKLGYTKNMYRKAKSTIVRNPFEKFKNWLALYGVKEIYYVSPEYNRFYCVIKL